MTFEQVMEGVVLLFELAGVAVLVVGTLATTFKAGRRYLRGERGEAYEAARQGIAIRGLLGQGRPLLHLRRRRAPARQALGHARLALLRDHPC